MIELSFVSTQKNVEETAKFLEEAFPEELCEDLCDWIPIACLRFSIQDDYSTFEYFVDNAPVLEFALRLNEIVHSIKVGETQTLFLTMHGCHADFTRKELDTIVVESRSSDHRAICKLSDLVISSESFCKELYLFIMATYPKYFDKMDSGYPEFNSGTGKPSERAIKILELHSQ